MSAVHKILIAVDDRDGARQAVEYVAAFVARRDDVEIHLLHALRPLPPQLPIRAALEYRCHTVVRYNDYPWIKERFHAHIAEQLIAQSERLAVCV